MLKIETIAIIGRDAVMNTVGDKKVINFSVAHTEKFKDRERTMWLECALWSDSEKLMPLFKKGNKIWLSGSPEVRTFKKQDGTFASSLSVRISDFEIPHFAK